MTFDFQKTAKHAVEDLLLALGSSGVDQDSTLTLYDSSKHADYPDDYLEKIEEVIKDFQLGKHIVKIEVLVEGGHLPRVRVTHACLPADLDNISQRLSGL